MAMPAMRPRHLLLLLLLLTATPAQADITSNLVGHWPLDEGSGTSVVNSVGGGGNGALVGGATWVAGQRGPFAVSVVAASSQYINFGDLATADVGTGVFTLALWVKGPAPAQTCLAVKDEFIGGLNGFYLFANTTPAFGWYNGSATTVFAGVANNAAWHHLAVVRSSTGAGGTTLYGDGVAVATLTESRNLSNTQPLRVGACATTNFTTATFDDIRLYHRALSATDITELFTATAAAVTRRRGRIQ